MTGKTKSQARLMRAQRTQSTHSVKLEVDKMKSQRDDSEETQEVQTNLISQSKQARRSLHQNADSKSQQTGLKSDS